MGYSNGKDVEGRALVCLPLGSGVHALYNLLAYFFFFCFFFFTPADAALVCVAEASAAAAAATTTGGDLSVVTLLVLVGPAVAALACCGAEVDETSGAIRFCIFCMRECVKASKRLRMIDDRVLYFKH